MPGRGRRQRAARREVEAVKTCATCKRDLPVGTSAWARDWTVIDLSAEFPRYRTETRFVCDECEGE